MQKVNTSPLNCFHNDCKTIPTIVLEFQHTRWSRIMGQIITCAEHKQEGISTGNKIFGRNILLESNYPQWLQRLHDRVLQTGIVENQIVAPEEFGRLRTFVMSRHRKPEGGR